MAKQKVERTNNIPSSPEDRKRLLGFVREAVDNRVMVNAQKAKGKDIRDAALDEFPITSRLFAQLVNFEFNQNYDKVTTEADEIFTAYDNLKNSQKQSP